MNFTANEGNKTKALLILLLSGVLSDDAIDLCEHFARVANEPLQIKHICKIEGKSKGTK